jgi:hypothetical protein
MMQTTINMPRFHQPDSEDFASLLNEKDVLHSKKATKVAVNYFCDYIAKCSFLNANFEDSSVEDLNQALKSFYVGVRKT